MWHRNKADTWKATATRGRPLPHVEGPRHAQLPQGARLLRRRTVTCKSRTPPQGLRSGHRLCKGPPQLPAPKTGRTPGQVRPGIWGAPGAKLVGDIRRGPGPWQDCLPPYSTHHSSGPCLPSLEQMSHTWASPAYTRVGDTALWLVTKGGPAPTGPVSLQLWVSRSGFGRLRGWGGRAEPSGHRPRPRPRGPHHGGDQRGYPRADVGDAPGKIMLPHVATWASGKEVSGASGRCLSLGVSAIGLWANTVVS